MDLVLVSITGISLLLAVAMGLVVFRLQRDERLRSEARVALLAASAQDDSIYLYEREAAALYADSEPAAVYADSEPAAVYADSEPAAAAAPLFASREADSPWLRRVAIAGAAAAGITLAVQAMTFVASPSSSKAASSQAAPLELVALQHAYDGSTLTVTGTVQNPKAGLPVGRIAVTATVLGDDGSTLATGRSALDYAALAPGEDSPFVVKIPVQGTVRRYRVGFRRPDGSILAHVDRRTGASSARHTGDTGSAPWVR